VLTIKITKGEVIGVGTAKRLRDKNKVIYINHIRENRTKTKAFTFIQLTLLL
jgi:hypothetical protein